MMALICLSRQKQGLNTSLSVLPSTTLAPAARPAGVCMRLFKADAILLPCEVLFRPDTGSDESPEVLSQAERINLLSQNSFVACATLSAILTLFLYHKTPKNVDFSNVRIWWVYRFWRWVRYCSLITLWWVAVSLWAVKWCNFVKAAGMSGVL